MTGRRLHAIALRRLTNSFGFPFRMLIYAGECPQEEFGIIKIGLVRRGIQNGLIRFGVIYELQICDRDR